MKTLAKIKICGLRRECDIEYVNRLKPDYIGYVFWQKSKRYVTDEQAEALTDKLDRQIIPVGVFVDEEPHKAARLANYGIIKAIQLHGHESEDYVRQIKDLTDVPVIKAFKIRSADDIEKADAFLSDYILLDNGYGTGQTFDWRLIKEIKRPFFLAGGINADNASFAINNLHPYAVDVSSGVETDGYKDFDKMQRFIQACR